MKRLRALHLAELCNPNWVSVPLVGWNMSRALADVTDSHLVTHVRNRENIVAAGLEEGRDFTALHGPHLDRALDAAAAALGARGKNGSWTTQTALAALAYYRFEAQVWRRFGEAIRRGAYDVVHRITPVSPAIPSVLARRCRGAGVPFVIGPINGGLPWPKEFNQIRQKESEWLGYLRGAYRLLPGYGATRRDARAIIVGSAAARREIPAWAQDKTVYIPENAVDPSRFGPPPRLVPGPLRVVFMGRLVAGKGTDMLIEAALPLARAGRITVDIIGDGPELPRLKHLAHDAGGGIRFPGWIAQRDLQRHVAGASVFAFPSVHDFGGAVVLEAMAMGLVPIVIGYGGPGELVSPTTGFAVPMAPRGEIVASFRTVLGRLAADPSMLAPMAQRARARIEQHFTWPVKAAQILEVYRWVLGHGDRPDFGMPLADRPGARPAGEAESGLRRCV